MLKSKGPHDDQVLPTRTSVNSTPNVPVNATILLLKFVHTQSLRQQLRAMTLQDISAAAHLQKAA